MRTTRKHNARQSIVLVVNIDSPNIVQVNIENTVYPVQVPINLADHTDSNSAEIILQAYQNKMLVGTPIRTAERIGLSSHQPYIFCKLS